MGFHTVFIRRLYKYLFETPSNLNKTELLKIIFTNKFFMDVLLAIMLVFSIKIGMIFVIGSEYTNITAYIFAVVGLSPLILYMEVNPGISSGQGSSNPQSGNEPGGTNNVPGIEYSPWVESHGG